MQEIMFARNEGPGVPEYTGTQRFLDGAPDIVVEQQGRIMASLFGLKADIGNQHFTQKPGQLHYYSNETSWISARIYAGERLVWSHAGAMCILQGMPVTAVLGPSWVVLGGVPTLPGDPLPGLRAPVLLDVFDNPAHRPHTEIFKVIREMLEL